MLTLTRKTHQGIVLVVPPSSRPTTLRVMVTSVERGKARLAFAAPDQVQIDREEIFLAKIAEQGREAG